jgi:hypothetical protein
MNTTPAGTRELRQVSAEGAKSSRRWAVFTIVEAEERSTWRRVGVAFLNRDGSFNVYLDALPLNGKLHLREVDGMPLNSERP